MKIGELLRLDIRGRLLLVAVAPLLSITLILGYYTVSSRLDDVLAAQLDRGRTIARHLASRSEFELFAGDHKALGRTAEVIARDEGIEWAAVFDATGELAAGAGPGALQDLPGGFQGERELDEKMLFAAPILASRVAVADFEAEAGTEVGREDEPPLGLALVVISKKAMLARQRQILRLSLALIAAGLLVSVILALAVGRRVSDSILRKNRALEQAREQALEAGRERTEFLARMSHEIRTPLNAVVGFSRLLYTQGGNPTAAAEHLRTIDRAAIQLQFVIDGILDFTRLDSGGVMLESRPFNLRDCVEDALAMVSREAHEKGLELVLLADSEVPELIPGDSARVTQVLVNLLNNAVKFTSAGHVTVTLRLGTTSAARVCITVSDTGIGIDAEKVAVLFRPFVQADSSITRQFGGTGLGLAISKRLVELMGGDIGVRSEKGKGAAFHFNLPLPAVDGPAADSVPRLPQARVLVCDPHPLVRRALRNQLLAWGLEPFDADTLEAAINLLAQSPAHPLTFDLLILSLGPGCTAVDAWKRTLSNIRAGYDGPVLLLDATEESHPQHLRSDWGPLAWADKPVRRHALYQSIRQLLKPSEEWNEAPPEIALEQPGMALTDMRGARILVAEDNGYNRLLMRALLGARGFRVDEVADGAAAVAAAARERFDMVFMDVHMPVLDGLEAARLIRALPPPNGTVSIVALTADVFSDVAGPDGGALDDYLLKPIDPEALDTVLGRYCPKHRDNAAATAAETIPAGLLPRLTEDLRAQCGALRSAIERKDRQTLLEQLHTLKGVCGYFGMSRERDLALALEQEGREGSLDKLQPILDDLESGIPERG